MGRRCRRLLATIPLVAAVVVCGCDTSSTITTASDAINSGKCALTLATPSTLDASAGTGSFTVTTLPECAWQVSTTVSWISGLSPANGQGNGKVDFRVAANDGMSSRDGDILINNDRVHVSQRAPCRFDVAPSSQRIGVDGGSGTINVAVSSECAWTATSDVNWIVLTPPVTGSGNGSVRFTAAANGGVERSGQIVVGDQRATITQSGVSTPGPSPAPPPAPTCTFSISPTSQNADASAGKGTVTVSTTSGCNWTAVSSVPWLTITSGASGSGNGSVVFTIAANTGAQRTGTIAIGGQTFTVTQAGVGAPAPAPTCTFSIAPTSQNSAASAGNGTVAVSAATGCNWTASSNVPWLTITSGGSGSGNGSVAFTIAANTGALRTGTITIAGQTFTVNQAAVVTPACTFTISSSGQNADSGAGGGSVGVSTAAGCTWTATSNVPWLTIASGASGSGNGTVTFTVAGNTGAARTGTLTIAGQTFTVTQAAFVTPTCSFVIAPTSSTVAANATAGTVGVTTATGCTWTASSNAPFLTVTSGAAGNGVGTVGYSVAANTGALRTGTLTIAGQTFTVTQSAPVTQLCTFSISPTTANVGAGASGGNVNVSTATGCTWTAVSSVPWLTIATGAAGNGNGSVAYNVAANSGPSRTGTISIAGQTFMLTQAAVVVPACTYSVGPTTQTVGSGAGAGTVTVSTTSNCVWNATTLTPWITITSGASGNGSGAVVFSIAANTGVARTGTISVAGQTATIQQAATGGPGQGLSP